MSRPDDSRPADAFVGAAQRSGGPTFARSHRPLGAADPAEAGPYRLEALLGEGGMGRVYLGFTPAGSSVAVKIVHRAYAGDPSFRKRFEQEVAAARRVQGLYTVPVIDADLAADEPWLATAYVPGPSLQQAVAESGPLSAGAALGLIARVAEALQSIHAAGVIHRDLKPSNIILTADGPKVIDFGIARAADVSAVTATGMRTGTPAYMAPEYIRGQSVTEAGDVFALGIIAHFAATGRLAFGGGTDHGVTYRILEQAPDLDGCPEPLRTIAARCLEKDPAQRPTPAEVIEQCRRAATNGTADAPTPTVVSTRGPGPTATPGPPKVPGSPDDDTRTAPPPGSGLVTPGPPRAPGAGAPTTPAPAGHAPTQAAAPGDPALPDAPTLPHSPSPGPGGAVSPRLFALIAGVGALVLVAVLIPVLLPSSSGTPRSGLPYPTVQAMASLTFPGQSKGARGMAFSPDGRTLATGSQEGKVRLWDVATRKPATTFTQRDPAGNLMTVSSVAFSPDGKTLASGSGDFDWVGMWDISKRRESHGFRESPVSMAFSPDGKLLAIGHVLGVDLRNVSSRGDDPRAFLSHNLHITDVAFSPDGRTLASVGDASEGRFGTGKHPALLWNVADLDPRPYGQGEPRTILPLSTVVSTVAFSPDGDTLATGGPNGEVQLWDVASGRQKATLSNSYVDAVRDLTFSPDGRTLATTASHGVLLWNVANRKPRAILAHRADGARDVIEEVAFSPNGRLIAGNDPKDRTVRLWKVPHSG